MVFISRYGYNWRDAQGYTGQTAAYTTAATLAANQAYANDVATTWAALTNAAIIGWFGVLDKVLDPNVYGVAADYLSATFRAEFTFNTAEGTLHKVGVPSPKRSIFMADGQTIDAAQSDVAAFLLIFLTPTGGGSSCTKDGTVIDQYVGGRLVKAHPRRKTTIWSNAADVTTPDE